MPILLLLEFLIKNRHLPSKLPDHHPITQHATSALPLTKQEVLNMYYFEPVETT